MSERYFLTEPVHDNRAMLTDDEAYHLAKVMRAKVGDEVSLFDGSGVEFSAKIEKIGKNRVILEVCESRTPNVEPLTEVTVAVALPKGDRQKWMIEKLTELGCRRVIPLQTERSVIHASPRVVERLQRQVLEASKQSGRLTLMEVTQEMSLGQLNEWRTDDFSPVIAHPVSDGDFSQYSASRLLTSPLASKILITIGPVGGLTYEEVQQAVHWGFLPVDLGPRLFRVETAAIALTASLIFAKG
ncbi:MAG: 16S rRNA (uracil(1498)-N(3))-methyltransferase [Planctomycetaceae bacterium]|jgi:16S rRNA (uracil1498-N3)-methyltransferase|nr:16S rRNA (uracil(1498)-N(3))-methyltransferase [Planctomycetaceae bacterium]